VWEEPTCASALFLVWIIAGRDDAYEQIPGIAKSEINPADPKNAAIKMR